MSYKMSYKKKGLWLLIPGLAGFLLFYVIPFVFSFYYAFIESAFIKRFVGLANFKRLINNKYYMLALKNTFEFTLIGVPLLVLISFILAVLLTSRMQKLRFFRAAFVMPVLLPSAAVVIVWKVLFDTNGVVTANLIFSIEFFKTFKLEKLPIYLFFIWKNAGFNMILFTAGLMGIPKEIYEAAESDGAGTLQKHLHITLPLLNPTTFFVLIISTVNSFKIFKEVYLLYGSYPSEALYTLQHFMNNHFNKLNYQYLTAAAIIFAAIVYLIVAAGYKLENRLTKGVW